MRAILKENPNYMVSTDGRVFNAKNGRELKQRTESGGRKKVRLASFGEYKNQYATVSRLVAKTYISNPDNKEQVDHIDGDRSNNHVSNLRWVTNAENQAHRVEQGNSGAQDNAKKILYDGIEYESIGILSRKLAFKRGSKTETVRKAIQGARYGEIKLYGKKLKFIS